MNIKNVSVKNLLGLGLAFCIGAGVYFLGKTLNQQEAQQRFNHMASEYLSQTTTDFGKYKTVLKGVQAFIVTNPDVTLQEFRQYIDSLDIVKNYPGFKSVNYAIDVSDEDKEKYQNQLRLDMSKYLKNNPELLKKVLAKIDYNGNRFSKHNEHFMIYYQEPIENSLFSVGRDIGDRETTYYTMVQMKKTGHAIQSGTLFKALDNDNKEFWAMGFRLPVFENKDDSHTYLGSVGVALNFGKVISGADPQHNYYVEVYENSNDNAKVMYSTDSIPLVNDKFQYNSVMDIENHLFRVKIIAKNPQVYYPNNKSLWIWLSILSGMATLGLWMAYGSLIYSNLEARKIAKNMTKDLEYMAWYDSLTDIMNRRRFIEIVDEKINKGALVPFSMYFIDIDGFKKINDTLGHGAGDKVLKEYAARLSELLSRYNHASLARVGGDEFVIKIDEQKQDFERWVELINRAVSEPFIIANHKFMLTQSIGITSYPQDGNDNETLLRKADMAMYEAKKTPGNHYVIYSEKLGEALIEKNHLENDLIQSIKNNELSLVYQPQMKKVGDTYELCGIEVLSRWNSPKWGNVSPAKFIPIAEENGFVEDITRWVVTEVCKNIKKWKLENHLLVPLSINIAGKQFLNEHLINEILQIIVDNQITSDSLIIEITEGTIMRSPVQAKEVIARLKNHGVQISIDDFGTGYSSFTYLKSFDVDELKIDKTFIEQSQENQTSKEVVEAIILMSHKLGIRVVAEGVETDAELDFLNECHCDVLQGFYFSTPVTEEIVLNFINK
jgi:diguanylate cyclase (GGDEF)-like protein